MLCNKCNVQYIEQPVNYLVQRIVAVDDRQLIFMFWLLVSTITLHSATLVCYSERCISALSKWPPLVCGLVDGWSWQLCLCWLQRDMYIPHIHIMKEPVMLFSNNDVQNRCRTCKHRTRVTHYSPSECSLLTDWCSSVTYFSSVLDLYIVRRKKKTTLSSHITFWNVSVSPSMFRFSIHLLSAICY